MTGSRTFEFVKSHRAVIGLCGLGIVGVIVALILIWSGGEQSSHPRDDMGRAFPNSVGPVTNRGKSPSENGLDPSQAQSEPETPPADASDEKTESAPQPAQETRVVIRDGSPWSPMSEFESMLKEREEEYQRVWFDPEATEKDKNRVRFLRDNMQKAVRRFQDLPGRNTPMLSGMRFEVADHPALVDYEINEPTDRTSVEIVREAGKGAAPLISMQRRMMIGPRADHVDFGSVGLTLTISIWSSRDWAQREFMKYTWLEIETSRFGDACSMENSGSTMYVAFVRHNVAINIQANFRQRPDGSHVDRAFVEQLAWEIDRKIQANAVAADTWADMAEHLPKVERFELDPPVLVAGAARERAAIRLSVTGPNDEPVKSLVRVESPPLHGGGERLLPIGVRQEDAPDEETTCRVWVVAYLPNLLFTVAETTVLVKPAPDSDD